MHVADAERAFREYLLSRGAEPDALTASDTIELMLDWYAAERVDDAIAGYGDMLLYQWGTYGWGGDPETFQYDITRQLISTGAEDDDDIWQLSLTLHFTPTPESAALGAGNQWCGEPGSLDELRTYIESSPATSWAREQRPLRVELEYFEAG